MQTNCTEDPDVQFLQQLPASGVESKGLYMHSSTLTMSNRKSRPKSFMMPVSLAACAYMGEIQNDGAVVG